MISSASLRVSRPAIFLQADTAKFSHDPEFRL